MEKVAQVFQSPEEADRTEDEYYKNLSPNERVDLLLQLVNQYQTAFDGSSKGFERVFRVTTLEES